MTIFREKLDIPQNKKIEICGVLKKIKGIEKQNDYLVKKLQKLEKKKILTDIDIRSKTLIISRLKKLALNTGGTEKEINEILSNENLEGSSPEYMTSNLDDLPSQPIANMKEIIEENEGLRNSLSEILHALKDNSKLFIY